MEDGMSDGALFVDAEFEARVKRNEPMSRHTSWHVGGPADVYFSPRDRADLLEFLATLPEGTPLFWLGLGSNLLVRDGGIRGVVIDTQSGLTRLERVNDTTHHLRSGRALRATRAPVHQVGPVARGVLRRYSRHAGWRAGHECRRLRRRNLAARAQRRRVRCARRRSPPRCARIFLRLSPHRAAGAR